MVGYTGKQVAKMLGRDSSTVRRWRRVMQDVGIPFEKDKEIYLFDDYHFRILSNLNDNLKDRTNYDLEDEVLRAIQGHALDTIPEEPLPQEKEMEFVNAITLQALENKWLNHFVELEEKVFEMAETIEQQGRLLADHDLSIIDLNSRDQHLMKLIREVQHNKKLPWYKRFIVPRVAAVK